MDRLVLLWTPLILYKTKKKKVTKIIHYSFIGRILCILTTMLSSLVRVNKHIVMLKMTARLHKRHAITIVNETRFNYHAFVVCSRYSFRQLKVGRVVRYTL